MCEEQSKWKLLLEAFVKENVININPEQKEREVTEMFIKMLEQQDKDDDDDKIPRFYYKKPIYNELYYNIKSEAKQRFLSIKSYEIPQKRRKQFY
jgi:hypothetical protein